MKLEFFYLPTPDLNASLALYRDALGFDEVWREGEHTVGLAVPGSEIVLMIDADSGPGWGPGPVFVTEDVHTFHAGNDGAYELTVPPFEIPGGLMSGFRDPGGAHVWVMDQSTEGA